MTLRTRLGAMTATSTFPVTQSYLTSISSDLKSFTAERKLEEVQDDLSVYGLDNPSCTITAKGSDDTEVTIQIEALTAIIQTIMQK